MSRYKLACLALSLTIPAIMLAGCSLGSGTPQPRLSLFVGVDVSGSFMQTEYFDDSIDFLAHYIYAHLNGLGGLEVPNVLFVSSIGGANEGEPKTFYPIQSFDNKSIEEIAAQLREIFPRENPNPLTDYNAFFEQVALTVKNKNLVLRPISIVMVSDGVPDVKRQGKTDFRSLVVKPLEKLARNVTVRLLYTDPVVGKHWQTKVPRSRVKIWTQDAEVLVSWKDPKILKPEKPIEEQETFFAWVKDNVDFGVRSRRVD
ncbi:MAG: hypothetical protein JSW64_00120 [Candidatus Zixiibacteriota bacterium]|nr:MAG: hypothetical protein JSW64_00120 [candidate division Zixibacteria bacterium]